MKLYAQIGHGLGDKLNVGLAEKLIDGAVFSPKDMPRDAMKDKIADVRKSFPKADVLVDPQFYVSLFADAPNANVGRLEEWKQYFRSYRKSELELSKTVRKVLHGCFQSVTEWEVTAIITPNIYIAESLDSREAVIAKSFIREARDVFEKTGDDRPLYASLVVCREALQDRREFEEFLNDITLLESPPDGIYLIVAGRSSEARSDFFHTDVLANWLLLNLSLSINGMQVINGYSDILTPFLGVAGGTAGATGWWSNLRMFSMGRFCPSGSGGRQPITRYLSELLLNRITFAEKEAIAPFVPGIINRLPHDADYDPEAERTQEALQSWEALRSLTDRIVTEDILAGIGNCRQAIELSRQAYAAIAATGISLDMKSRDDHIEPLDEALKQFKERAELK
ncbi:MAG: hypothetical protein HYU36_16560 [Planctomycetes bacterium]|nr:hypothetical protein [Planctomycetota bacterium]